MKKLISLLLAACTCLSVGASLAACKKNDDIGEPGGEESHEHSYQTEWLKDATHHWHECGGENCAEASDKAEHTWNDGEITSEATADADGVKTFTCSVCGETKTESVKHIPQVTVTEAEWRAALAKELFYNVTLTYSEYRYDDETETAECRSTSIIEYDGERMRSGEKIRENVDNHDMSTAEVSSLVGRGLALYADADYDAEKQRYLVISYDDYYDMPCGLVYQFADGKLVFFEYHFLSDETADDMYKIQWIQWEFSKYGTTVIPDNAE